ncbi:PH domain-containing protein [Patescibacteria group bacterium]|nr:PH domain-containing protein [Patescibacteria group bacterium]MBU0879736.1 PH domain-containing protein [Patescibacteria group bacterium]MBU0880491.1 PH domain-containing protein [Patescibacteria group bacterium]MBU1783259.1 PH domain-containing protein [Patescibacteria group bacterium]MBU2081215.1 PH domain-containing protein [Patescibacteria group bacterium]
MNKIITEKNYPVQKIYIFKATLGSFFILVLIIIFLIFFNLNFGMLDKDLGVFSINFIIMFSGLVLIRLIIVILQWINFYYSIEENFLTSKQGILLKQQQHISYGNIKNIFIKQNFFDKFFGLFTLIIEDASQKTGILASIELFSAGFLHYVLNTYYWKRFQGGFGFFGNKIFIPGLKKEDAEILKGIILQKIKENSCLSSQT